MPAMLATAILVTAWLMGMVVIVATRYKRCPADKALVVFGRVDSGSNVKIFQGGGALVIPFIQGYAWLDLRPIAIEVRGRGLGTSDGATVDVAMDVRIAISKDTRLLENAAERLLGMDQSDIGSVALDVAHGVLAAVVRNSASMDLLAAEPLDEILAAYIAAYETEVAQLGLEVLSARFVAIDTADTERCNLVLQAVRELLSERATSGSSTTDWATLSHELDELADALVTETDMSPTKRAAIDGWKRGLAAWAATT